MAADPALPEEERSLALIGDIYDASLRPELWRGVMDSVVRHLGGTKGLLYSPTAAQLLGRELTISNGLNIAGLERLTAVAARGVHEDEDALPKDLPRRTPGNAPAVYRDYFATLPGGRLCSGVVFGPDHPTVPTTVCSVFRPDGAPAFGDEERQKMRVLAPHLSRALALMFRLRDAEIASLATRATLEGLPAGILLLNDIGEVKFANLAARRILAERDGISLFSVAAPGIVRRRLSVQDMRARAAMDEALRGCCGPNPGPGSPFAHGALVPRPSGKPPYVLQFAPLSAGEARSANARGATAIVVMTDPRADVTVDRQVLKDLYGFTDPEASLALLLCSGDTLSEAAALLKVPLNTARGRLQNVFGKTGTARQAELVKLVLSLTPQR